MADEDVKVEGGETEMTEKKSVKEEGDGREEKEGGVAGGGKEVEIGREWDAGVENKELGTERDAEEEEDVVQVVESGNVSRSGAGKKADEAEEEERKAGAEEEGGKGTREGEREGDENGGDSGHKRRREEADEVEGRGEQPPMRDMVAAMPPPGTDYPGQYRKRARQECYRCGGDGHIAVMCISEPNAKTNLNLTVCRNCNGRGHMSRDCPNSIPPGVCFRCRREGHRGRECPNMDVRLAQYSSGGGEGSLGAIHSLNALLGGVTGQQPQGAYYGQQVGGGGYDAGYGYDRGMYGDMMGGRPRAQVGTGRCFRCNEPGHWTKDCPYKPQGSDPNGCYKCGQPGHRAKECNVCFKCHGYGHNAFECPQIQQAH